MTILQTNLDLTILIAGVVVVITVMLGFWWFAGRSPKADFVLLRADPPRDLSPVELSWIYARAMGEDVRRWCFVTAMISLGLKRQIFLEHKNGWMTVKRSAPETTLPEGELAPEEEALLQGPLAEGKKLSFDIYAIGDSRWAGAFLSDAIAPGIAGRMFTKHNMTPMLVGIGIAWFSIGIAAYLDSWEAREAFAVMMGFFCGCGMGPAVNEAYRQLAPTSPTRTWSSLFIREVLLTILPIVIFFFSWEFGAAPSGAEDPTLLHRMLAAATMGTTLSTFYTRPLRPTNEGRQVLAEIEGFRTYLSGARPEQLALVNLPEFTRERYERLLPYAVALGEEWAWSVMFERQVEETQPNQPFKYRLRFYSGPVSRLGGFANNVALVVGAIHAPRGHR